MKIIPTQKSLNLVKTISEKIKTSHHFHFHLLYDIANLFEGEINYVEIGCYAGKSACLMMQRPKTNVFSIDIGRPISKETALNNIKEFNIHNNNNIYIENNSHSNDTIELLKNSLKGEIDIFFIDGGHSYNDIINDFCLYENMVKKGGYIIFDDYNDAKFSPKVKTAVDYLIKNKFNEYNIIGTLKNDLLAYPINITSENDGNCFIIQKK